MWIKCGQKFCFGENVEKKKNLSTKINTLAVLLTVKSFSYLAKIKSKPLGLA